MEPQSAAGKRTQLAALREENERLRLRLVEAEQTLAAIRRGEVDSLVIEGPQGPRVYGLDGPGNAYRVLLESMSEGAATLSGSGVILYCNGRLASLLETPLQRVMGASFGAFVAEPARAAFESLLTRDEVHVESAVQTADGVQIPVYLSTNAIEVDGERTSCLVVVDLRAQKHADALAAAKLAAEESDAWRRLASEVARVGTFEWDIVHDVNRWSPELEALYGLAPGTFEGTYEAWSARVHPDDLPGAEASVRKALDSGSFHAEFRVIWPNGDVRWLESRATVIKDASDRPLRFVGANVDTTERREEQALLQSVIASVPVGVALADKATRKIVFANDSLVRMLGGVPRDTVLGPYGTPLARALDRAEEIHGEEVGFSHPSGRRLALRVSALPLRDAHGTQMGALLVVDDVTEERNRARFTEQFVGILGHDLQNPLGAIKMAATLLKRTVGDNKYVESILSSTNRMANMVDQVLDLTRGRLGGSIPVERRALTLNEVVAKVVDELRLVHAGREIRCKMTPDVRGHWDGPRLAQVVSNLVGNALQHGDPHRPVDLRLTASERDAVLEVHNFGPPIPADLVPVLFDAYRRGDARGRSLKGLGLGLYITQQIVLAHGGRVDVASSDEAGTTFTVTLSRH